MNNKIDKTFESPFGNMLQKVCRIQTINTYWETKNGLYNFSTGNENIIADVTFKVLPNKRV